MSTNYFGNKKHKVYVLGFIILAITLIAFMFNIFPKSSHKVANRTTKPIYKWKAGVVRIQGNVMPDGCALTTKNCVCNLSESQLKCEFNFNFYDVNDNVSIEVKQNEFITPPTIFNKSSGCTSNKTKQIENCSIDFQWNKKESGNEKLSIIMEGAKGSQSLVNLQINAN